MPNNQIVNQTVKERVARIEENVIDIKGDVKELLKVVKGDNGEGLCVKVGKLQTSNTWLTWGFRVIGGSIVTFLLWVINYLK